MRRSGVARPRSSPIASPTVDEIIPTYDVPRVQRVVVLSGRVEKLARLARRAEGLCFQPLLDREWTAEYDLGPGEAS